MKEHGRDTGLTLLELVVAMAIFALVAVMGAQALSGMLRMRDALGDRGAQTAELMRATSILRNDLSATLPLLFYPPERGAPQSALRFRGDRFSLSVGGQMTLRGDRLGVSGPQRVEWTLRNGQLTRQHWATLIPAREDALGPAQIVLTGVTGWRIRSLVRGRGWIDGLPNTTFATVENPDGDGGGGAPEVYSSTLPAAIELVIETSDLGTVSLLEAF